MLEGQPRTRKIFTTTGTFLHGKFIFYSEFLTLILFPMKAQNRPKSFWKTKTPCFRMLRKKTEKEFFCLWFLVYVKYFWLLFEQKILTHEVILISFQIFFLFTMSFRLKKSNFLIL